MTGAPEKIVTATMQIPVNKSAATTFLLSGWSKGDSIPGLASDAAEKPLDTGVRFWGITLTLNYSADTKDASTVPTAFFPALKRTERRYILMNMIR